MSVSRPLPGRALPNIPSASAPASAAALPFPAKQNLATLRTSKKYQSPDPSPPKSRQIKLFQHSRLPDPYFSNHNPHPFLSLCATSVSLRALRGESRTLPFPPIFLRPRTQGNSSYFKIPASPPLPSHLI